ncbi:M1 family metallopeptidase [Bacteroidota bacterium]
MKFSCLSVLVLLFSFGINAQNNSYWQQHVAYKMDIDMDVKSHQYIGKQNLTYTNNSPDDLTKVFYHLYLNAFQPNSEMDIRLQTIKDPDVRMTKNLGTKEKPIIESRISVLKPDEIGFIKVKSLLKDGVALNYHVQGTVLEVELDKPIKSGETTIFEMEFLGQVPLQIRRSGRDNREGVAYSMAQWYPKMAEYDFEGWHADAYIAREFHGVWGDFDVTIHIDKKYVVGGSGYLQNADEVGHGYEEEGVKVKKAKGKKLTWHFKAPKVHDFTWAADPKFKHDIFVTPEGTKLHFLYKKDMDKKYLKNWKALQPKTAELLSYYNKHVGAYPYKQYSVIQGGDGGMEYAMSTLITGQRELGSLVGVVAHEMAHSWFQFVLATNEQKHPWMDEGFTTYISNLAEDVVLDIKAENPNAGSYRSYFNLVNYNIQEPLTTHADCYHYNYTYSNSSYSKGALFLSQLEYIIGEENTAKSLKNYYSDFKFKHPVPNDIKRVAEKNSGISLEWYLNNWTQTTNTIDYSVSVNNSNEILLERIGKMPMPIDLKLTYADGSVEDFYIPLVAMRGNKATSAKLLPDWSWVLPTYQFITEKEVVKAQIDTSNKMADVNKNNNVWPHLKEEKK